MEHVVFVRRSAEEEWTELSKHESRDEAHAKMRETLADESSGWTLAKIDPGAELFMRRPGGSVIEVMAD